jgi:hypothetical protein
MSDSVYFEGDPATDSSRRHMERVLKGEPTRKWPWLLAAVASGGLFALWRVAGQAQPAEPAAADTSSPQQGAAARTGKK